MAEIGAAFSQARIDELARTAGRLAREMGLDASSPLPPAETEKGWGWLITRALRSQIFSIIPPLVGLFLVPPIIHSLWDG